MKKITKFKRIIIHCSGTDKHHTTEDVFKWHLKRDFEDIGYHFIIEKRPDGLLVGGRSLNYYGAHTKGFNDSIGICLLGNHKFSEDQFKVAADLIRQLLAEYNLTWDQVLPHNVFNRHKTCPNFDLKEIHKYLIKEIKMSEEVGIKETKEVVEGVIELSVIIAESLKDGFQASSDLTAILVGLSTNPKMIAAYDNVKGVGEEVKDLSVNEGIELGVLALSSIPRIIDALKK